MLHTSDTTGDLLNPPELGARATSCYKIKSPDPKMVKTYESQAFIFVLNELDNLYSERGWWILCVVIDENTVPVDLMIG